MPGAPFPPPGTAPGRTPLSAGKRRTRLIAALLGGGAVLATVKVLTLGLFAFSHHGNIVPGTSAAPSAALHTITLPAAAYGYSRMTGIGTQMFESAARQEFTQAAVAADPAWGKAYAWARIGIYTLAPTGLPSSGIVTETVLTFVGFSRASSPQVSAAMGTQSPSATLGQFLLSEGILSWRPFPAGPLGGALGCGTSSNSPVPQTMCAWADSSVVAGVALNHGSPSELAQVALAFRSAAEH